VPGVRVSVEPSLDPTSYAFAHDIRVRFAETDAMGIVHHSRYFPYLEEARVAYLRSIGHPYDAWRSEGIESAVLEAGIRYRRPLAFDEVVTVHLRLAAVTRTTFQIAYLLTVEGEPRSTAVTVHGCVTPAGRPMRLPAWMAAYAPAAP
jgi:acyl-CoA thioester hydrolase